MSISSRIHDTLESWSAEWRDRLGGWLFQVIGLGITKSLEDMEPGAIDSFRDTLTKLRDDPLTPPEMRTFYNKALTPGNWLTELIAGLIMALGALPAVLSAGQPLGNLMNYIQERELKTFRIDPLAIITAWRRDPEKYAYLLDDLKDQGWSDERIEALKFYTLYYPVPADLVRWQAREVFEPNMITKYGLDDELGGIQREPFYKAGMTDEQITNYWRAHWEHASYMQMVEMLHRGLITEQEFYEWFRLVEVVPYWRDNLIQTAYTWPTRVDVRRWWDMRTIDEPRLRELYSGMGYRGKNLDDYVLWTKVYVAFPDLMARWTNGWITEDTVRQELVALGMPSDRVEEMMQQKIKPSEPARTVDDKNLTKTEIYKGVKKELITWEEGIELLMDLGYSEAEADYILAINVGSLEGSPETYEEFKEITQKYQRAQAMEVKPMTEEIKKASEEVVRVTGEVETLNRAIADEERGLVEEEVLPEEATKRLKQLRVKRNRALATLQTAKLEYDRLVAEWRHGTAE